MKQCAENLNDMSIFKLLCADLCRYHYSACGSKDIKFSRSWYRLLSPRFLPVTLYRISHSCFKKRVYFLAKFFALLNQCLFGIEIAYKCSIGPGLIIPHSHGTVIGAWSIGENATIFQGVTLGAKQLDFLYSKYNRPIVGNDVTLGAGSKIIGGIMVGDNVTVGANSVVTRDILSDSLAVGIPARIIKK